SSGSDSSFLYASQQSLASPSRFALKDGLSLENLTLQVPLLDSTNGSSLYSNVVFYPLIEVNPANPRQIAIGTTRAYIGTDLLSTNIAFQEIFSFSTSVTALALGAMENGSSSSVLYVAAGSDLRLYTGAQTNLSFPGGQIRDLVLDPLDSKKVFACDSS